MNVIIKNISFVYYMVYTFTILLTIVGYFLDLNNMGFSVDNGIVVDSLTTILIIYVIFSIVFSFYYFYKRIKLLRSTDDDLEIRLEKYKQVSILRIILIGVGLLSGIVIFYLLRSEIILYSIGTSALFLILSKPSETKMISDLKIKTID
ncbi:MAG: hypothetical protein VB102_09400 [Paludibacter sp.]|nr:hypothetical protein [Paludibacter sp.]